MPAEPIAILALDVCLPGSGDLSAYWQRLLSAEPALAPLPPQLQPPGRCIHGGWFPPLQLKALTLGLPPPALRATERAQLELLHLCQRLMRSAPSVPPERTRLALGCGLDGQMADALTCSLLAEQLPTPSGPAWAELKPEVAAALREEMATAIQAQSAVVTEDSAMGQTGLYAAGRIAWRLDVRGGYSALNAACASSHLAVLEAARWLERDECDLVIVAAGDYGLTRRGLAVFAASGALSPQNQCRPFDVNADGTLLGMGCAAMLLARSRDAREHGWPIKAEILGGAMASNGRVGSLSQPSADAIVATVDAAAADAGIDFRQVRYWEAHGTGTALGDTEELRAAARCVAVSDSAGLMLGTLKSLIGHTRAASGLAALAKCVLAMQHNRLPPLRHIREPRAPLGDGSARLTYPHDPAPWPTGRRLALVPALGLGGINAALIVAGDHDRGS